MMILSPPRCSLLFPTQEAGRAAGFSEQLLGCQGCEDVIPAAAVVTNLQVKVSSTPPGSSILHRQNGII